MSNTPLQFDIVWIGSGPAGYVGAIRSAQLGLKTAVIEKEKTFGGTCLNVGCIPSKALLESSELYHAANHEFETHGIEGKVKFNLQTMMGRKDKIVKDLTNGIAFLFKKNKIESFKGMGRILKPGLVEVKSEDQSFLIEAKHIVCATGSVPVELPFLKFQENKVVSSTGALSLPKVPEKMVVVGGGVIGLELGSVWARLGAEVTVVEYAPKLCPMMDQQMIQVLQKSLTKMGVKFLLSTKVTGSEISKDGKVQVAYESMTDGKAAKLSADVVLVSTGRKPFKEGLGLENIGINLDKLGRVTVNDHFQTNIPGIYAVGDLIAGPMLAHKAEEEAVALAEIIAGTAGHINYHTVPSVVYTFPEVASVGYSEEQCKEMGLPVKIGTFPFLANGRAKALGQTEGLVKIIAHAESDKILGGHIVGPRASELLGEVVVAMEFGGSSEDLARSFHAHPTLNEVVREAALAVDKRARQM
jgi:dihydrolipoamide dehydrogenase